MDNEKNHEQFGVVLHFCENVELHPQKLTWIPKMTPYLKPEMTLKQPSFLVFMLDFAEYSSNHFSWKCFNFWMTCEAQTTPIFKV